jgi:hypothetical protein
VPVVHEVIGYGVVAAFGVLFLAGGVFWLRKREPGDWFWRLLAVVQVVLGVQIVVGLILLAIYGFDARPKLHYLYGSVFPVVVLVIGHVMARDMERDQWKVFAVAGFICFGLTLRALMTGLGIG